ncbi:MAG TPA: TerC family protein, partial [Bacteroidia bacterium]|nr:TerC family protein [Bacteroidia bacterium]
MDIAAQFQALLTLHGIASLLMLAVLELVLGIDNIIFISLVIAKLPEGNRLAARISGLSLAMVMRLFMLWGLVWL